MTSSLGTEKSLTFFYSVPRTVCAIALCLGIPFVYELDEDMKPVVSMQFLGDEETVKKAIGKLFVYKK